jgi:hypothetical protein
MAPMNPLLCRVWWHNNRHLGTRIEDGGRSKHPSQELASRRIHVGIIIGIAHFWNPRHINHIQRHHQHYPKFTDKEREPNYYLTMYGNALLLIPRVYATISLKRATVDDQNLRGPRCGENAPSTSVSASSSPTDAGADATVRTLHSTWCTLIQIYPAIIFTTITFTCLLLFF